MSLLFHWSHRRPLQLLWKRTDVDGQNFLLQRPDGAYTTMRTLIEGRRIFDWQMHLDRLHSSSASSLPKETFQESMTILIRNSLELARNSFKGDLKLTVLLGEETEKGAFETENNVPVNGVSINGEVSVHVTPLVRLDEVLKNIQVEVRGSPRHDPNKKSTEYKKSL